MSQESRTDAKKTGTADSPPVANLASPVAPVEHTDAQKAGMTDAEWNALSDDDRAMFRLRFSDPTYRTDAQRAGLTPSQWGALSEAERAQLRERFPDLSAKSTVVTTPSPPNPNFTTALGVHSPSHEQSLPAHVPSEAERVEAAKRDPSKPAPGESLAHLQNAPGGRNNPSLSNFDPSREPTE